MASGIYVRTLKSKIDRIVAALVLVLLSPLFLLVVLMVKLESPGPLFFRQLRVGQGEQTFELFKFRTMIVDPDRVLSQTHGKSPGVTRGGRWLRRLKIDEMPQLVNVLLGDMSLVGPRPCMPALLETIEPWARVRFTVRPGLTGLAQINGNVHLTWPERWRWDRRYVQTASWLTDLRILARTLLVMAFGEQRFRQLPPS